MKTLLSSVAEIVQTLLSLLGREKNKGLGQRRRRKRKGIVVLYY
jgi:hypothetical protein